MDGLHCVASSGITLLLLCSGCVVRSMFNISLSGVRVGRADGAWASSSKEEQKKFDDSHYPHFLIGWGGVHEDLFDHELLFSNSKHDKQLDLPLEVLIDNNCVGVGNREKKENEWHTFFDLCSQEVVKTTVKQKCRSSQDLVIRVNTEFADNQDKAMEPRI